jgi:hypothetical protein
MEECGSVFPWKNTATQLSLVFDFELTRRLHCHYASSFHSSSDPIFVLVLVLDLRSGDCLLLKLDNAIQASRSSGTWF